MGTRGAGTRPKQLGPRALHHSDLLKEARENLPHELNIWVILLRYLFDTRMILMWYTCHTRVILRDAPAPSLDSYKGDVEECGELWSGCVIGLPEFALYNVLCDGSLREAHRAAQCTGGMGVWANLLAGLRWLKFELVERILWLKVLLLGWGFVWGFWTDGGVVEQVFYGPPEPTFLVDTDPHYQRRPHMLPPPAYYPRGVDPAYRTRALVAPSGTQTHVVPGNRSMDKVRSHPKVWHRLAVFQSNVYN